MEVNIQLQFTRVGDGFMGQFLLWVYQVKAATFINNIHQTKV